MKIRKIFFCLCTLSFLTTCMAYNWKKWQESLDLARPEQLILNVQIEKLNLKEGEPLLTQCYIINNSLIPAKILVRSSDRKEALRFRDVVFTVSKNGEPVLGYLCHIHDRVSSSPENEKLLSPKDSIYLNSILWPDNFYDKQNRRIVSLHSSNYGLLVKIYLGTKFYPRPARGLFINSDTINFAVNVISEREKTELEIVRPFMKEFFGYAEEMGVSDSCRNLAYPVLDKIRKSDSYLASYADFVYIGMLAFDGDKSKLDNGIIEAQRFIQDHQGSILGEEMEFLLVKMFYRKEGKSDKFLKQAQHVLQKYPKNINNIGVKNLLEEK